MIEEALIRLLRSVEWYVHKTHGNEFSMGLPDLYCAHRRYGQRWVEVKNPLAYSFTRAQLDEFPKITAAGIGIWILTAATEIEYQKLFKSPNWYQFLPVMR